MQPLPPNAWFPHIPRHPIREQVGHAIAATQKEGQSRALLFYGRGGIGKTHFLRQLFVSQPNNIAELTESRTLWLGPYDMDDGEFWLLTNLENEIARKLDPEGIFFKDYYDYQAHLLSLDTQRAETLFAHTREGEHLFFKSYQAALASTAYQPVLVLDTLEAVRGLDFLPTLVRWLKNLPKTTLLLALRPSRRNPKEDQLVRALRSSPPLPFETIHINELDKQETRQYLDKSGASECLAPAELQAAVELSNGSPLWLALFVNYLHRYETPPELAAWQDAQATGDREEQRQLRDDFLRTLLVQYRDSSFWSEAIKRLSAVRRRINLEIWKQLMGDYELPAECDSWEAAWSHLLELPWIRARANRSYITLHDALAEELAKRVIPMDDQDRTWRQQLWVQAADCYQQLIDKEQTTVSQVRAELSIIQKSSAQKDPRELISDLARRNVSVMSRYLLESTALFYQILSNGPKGIERFIALYEECYDSRAYPLIELLWLELQHFLPSTQGEPILEDLIRTEIDAFQVWYKSEPMQQAEIEQRVGRYLTYKGRPQDAIAWLSRALTHEHTTDEFTYQVLTTRANTQMRLVGGHHAAQQDLQRAWALTSAESATPPLKARRWEALMELGYFSRTTGDWDEAARYYLQALEATPVTDRAANARIQGQYAYVLALRGNEQDAADKIALALALARRAKRVLFVAQMLSIQGEIYRYQRKFSEAMTAYEEADALFLEMERTPWLATIRHQMAICMFQSARGPTFLAPPRNPALLARAETFALEAVQLARDTNLPALPLALNRAGRIVTRGDRDAGIALLLEGAKISKEMGDRWLLLANLVENAAHSYLIYEATGDQRFLENLFKHAPETEEVLNSLDDNALIALRGRWKVARGHLELIAAVDTSGSKQLAHIRASLPLYSQGYLNIAQGYPGMRTSRALHERLGPFLRLLRKLSEENRLQIIQHLDEAWRSLGTKHKRQVPALTTFLGDVALQLDEETGGI